MKESLKIITADGVALSATRYLANKPGNRVVLINSATGVKQGFYAPFAEFLAGQGFDVYTYDYRGIGESRPASLRKSRATMHEWGAIDYDTMVRNILQTRTRANLTVIGHSVGGQIVGLSPASQQVDLVIMVGSQTPFWRNYSGPWMRAKLWMFWNFTIPAFTKIFGYFPAKALGLFEDLPAGVASQWARWANSANYLFDEMPQSVGIYRSLRVPSIMISFSDDQLAPLAAVKDLMSRYESVKWNHWHFEPRDLRERRIGHFGFFRPKLQSSLWYALVESINNPSQVKESKAA